MPAILFYWVIAAISGCSCGNRAPDFNITNRENVKFISVIGNDTVEIARLTDKWELKGGWMVEPVMLENFMYTFENIEIIGATAGKSIDSLNSRRIIIQEKNRIKRFRFYSGEDFYLLHHEGASRIYRIQVKSRPEADLSMVFSDRIEDWQSRKLLDFTQDELLHIEVFPGASYGEGFILQIQNDSIRLFNSTNKQELIEGIDPEKLIIYLSYFGEVYFEGEIDADSIRDRLVGSDPFFRFIVHSSEKEPVDFSIYPLYLTDGKEDIFYGALRFKDNPRTFRVNYVFLDLIFQDLSYFSVE